MKLFIRLGRSKNLDFYKIELIVSAFSFWLIDINYCFFFDIFLSINISTMNNISKFDKLTR